MPTQKDNNRLAVVLMVLGALLVIAVGTAGYFAYQARQNTINLPASTVSPRPTTQATSTPSPLTTPTPIVSLGSCTTAGLSASLMVASSSAGTSHESLALTNISNSSCVIEGYPGVSLVSAGGATLGQPAARDAVQTPQPITLAPSQSVYADLGFPDPGAFAPGQCSGAASLRIFPPDQTASLLVPIEQSYCPGFSVTTLSSARQ